MQMSYLYTSDFPFKHFQHTESLNIQKQYEKNVCEKSNDAYSLSIRVQTHISIFTFLCFLRQYQRNVKENVFFQSARHSRPQRPRSFWPATRIATSGLVQRHSVCEWLCKHNRLRPEPIRFVKLDSEHAQSDGKSVNRGLPVLDLARGRASWC